MQDYLITKKPLPALLIFALPMMIGNLFQQTYTMVDSAIVGRYVSEQALAAVGASSSLTNIFICVAIGGGIGASVIVSRYFGAGNFGRMKTATSTAMLSFLMISLVLAVIGLCFSRSIMVLLNTPPESLDLATQYLDIYFYGLPLLFMYNIISSMFNALGKSKIPLVFLIFSSLLNVGLDYYMVTALHMGVAGVAWATFIAQGLSAVLSFFVFLREMKRLEGKASAVFDGGELKTMARIALPSVFQQSTVSIGMMLVQSVVNSFGAAALAGFSAGSRIESICIVPMLAIGNSLSSYTAQNLGAGKPERVPQGYRVATGMVLFFAALIGLVLQLFHEPIIRFFLEGNGSTLALETGNAYLSFIGWFFCLIGFKMSVDGVLRGSGDMKMFTVANFMNLTLRVVLSLTLAPRFGIAMVWYAVPIGWFVNWLISFLEYRTGKWKHVK